MLLVTVLRYRRKPSYAWAAAAGAVLALGSAFRPSFVVAGVGPIIWAIGFGRFRHLLTAGLVSAAGALAWILPTLQASGGYARWRSAHDWLVHQVFFRTSSPFSEEAVPEFVWFNLLNTGLWLFLALAPAIVAGLARRGRRNPLDEAYREARALAWWSATPSVLFYIGMFCSEPGYLLGFVPPVIVATALAATPGLPRATRRLTLALAATTQLFILVLPGQLPSVGKVPSIPELVGRDVVYRTMLEQLAEQLPRDARILYLSDFPDIVLSRQLPVLHPSLHAMIYHSEHFPGFQETCLGYVTPDDWIPIPGPVLLQTGEPTILDVPFTYDFVVLDPVSSDDLRNELRKHSPCDLGSGADDLDLRALPVETCFPEGLIEVHGQGARFQVPED